jgi:RNA recognition motif-containing protein
MAKKIYIGNLSFAATDDDLQKLFSTFGEIESVKTITDAATARSKGFGFIAMPSEGAAQNAMSGLQSTAFMDQTITVSEAYSPKPRQERGFDNNIWGSSGKTIIAETAGAGPAEEGDKNFGYKSLWKRC